MIDPTKLKKNYFSCVKGGHSGSDMFCLNYGLLWLLFCIGLL